jgi:hypothetical protein
MGKIFFFIQKKTSLSRAASFQGVLLLIASMLTFPNLLAAAGQRHNPWSYQDNSQVPTGVRPWANMPPMQPSRQYNSWREPPVGQQYNMPAYPYQGYMNSPNTGPYYGYGNPYNPYQLPGYGGMNGIYPGLQDGQTVPDTMFLYPGW